MTTVSLMLAARAMKMRRAGGSLEDLRSLVVVVVSCGSCASRWHGRLERTGSLAG